MAVKYFAYIDDSNVVQNILVYDVNTEEEGIALYRDALGNQNANIKETFENASDASTRYNYAIVGGTWDDSNSAFINIQNYPSWTLNSSFQWVAPVADPTTDYVGDVYVIAEWDEAGQKWNGLNTNNNVVEYVWNPTTLEWDTI